MLCSRTWAVRTLVCYHSQFRFTIDSESIELISVICKSIISASKCIFAAPFQSWSFIQSNFTNYFLKPALICREQVQWAQSSFWLGAQRCVGSSFEIDDAKLKHNQVEHEEGESKQSGGVTFARNSKYADAIDKLWAKIFLLLLLGQGIRSLGANWAALFIWESGGLVLSLIVATFSCSMFFRVSRLLRISCKRFIWDEVAWRGRDRQSTLRRLGFAFRSSWRTFFRVLLNAGFSFERVGAWQARCRCDKVSDGKHDVENCRTNFLIQIFVWKTGTEKCNIYHYQNFLEARILRQNKVFKGQELINWVVGLVAKFLELCEQAIEVFVLVFKVLSEVAKHQLRHINLRGWLRPTLLKTIALATRATCAKIVIQGWKFEWLIFTSLVLRRVSLCRKRVKVGVW